MDGAAHLLILCMLLSGLLTALVEPMGAQEAFTEDEPRLAYWSSGPARAELTIIVVHGGPGLSHDYLLPEWSTLTERARVVFYDQRGCGRSGSAEDYSITAHVSDLRRIVAAVASPGSDVVLAGSSWGALLAFYFAHEHAAEIRALVLSGLPAPSVWTRPGVSEPVGPLPDADVQRARDERTKGFETLRPRMTSDCPEVQRQVAQGIASAPEQWRLYDLDVPVLFLPDNRFGHEFRESALDPEKSPDGQFWTVVGGGHDPWHFYSGVFFSLVGRFLDQVQ